MKPNKILALVLVLVLVLSLLTGCGKTAEETPSTTPDAQAGTPVADSAGTAGTVSTNEAGEITFTFARPEEIATFDPLNNNALVNTIHNHMVYDCLLATDENYNLSPCLAKDWKVADDNLSITFYLEEGVKFHNGSDFTAEDVKITFGRLLEPDCTLTQLSNFAALKDIEVVDDYTVTIYLNNPDAYILSMLAKFPVIDGQLYEEMGESCFDLNIGTGPWKFVEWKAGIHIEYERNDDYWQGVTSNVDRCYYVPLMEDTTRISALRTGDVDMIDSIPTADVATLQSEGLEVLGMMSTDQLYIGYQFLDSVMADKNVRLAFSHAIDREAIATEILGSGRASNFPTGEGGKGYDPNYPTPAYDPDLARQLLADSSYNGETIRVIGPTANYEKITETMTAIYYYLLDVGFNVDMEQLENAAFSDARKSGQYDVYIVGASFGGGDGYGYINQRIVGDSLASHYGNEELNNMILASNQIMDDAARQEALKELYTKIMDDCAPFNYIVQYQFNYAYKPGISGIQFKADKGIDYSGVVVN